VPLVSVIMNCRNCEKYLREALDSVYAQTFKDFEIIFWDNMSTDRSAEIALDYGEPLRYFWGEKPLPLGAARNAAIEQARGKYIGFLDCDDIWLPDKLEKQVELLEADGKVGLAYSDCHLIDEKGNPKTDTRYHVSRFTGMVFDRLLDHGDFIPMPTAIIRRDVYDEVGIFNPKYEAAEEYDLWMRIAERYKVGFTDKPLAKYRMHGTNISRNLELLCDEWFQIIGYWVDRKPDLKRGTVKQSQVRVHISLLKYYLSTRQKQKCLGQCFRLIKLFPYSLILIQKIVFELKHMLLRKRANCTETTEG